MKRVVVTGLGVVSPLGNNIEQFWKALKSGKSGARLITKFDTTNFKTHFACEISDFNPELVIPRAELRKYDLYSQYALVSAAEAMTHARVNPDELDKDRVGVIWASGDGGVSTFEEQFREFVEGNGIPRFNPFFIPKRIINMASGLISIKYGFRGVNYAPVAACSASNTALIEAYNHIRWGTADMIITGGSEASITVTSIGGFNASKAMSTRNEDFEKASRPFDKTRDGFVLGEGGGALILESLESAQKRNAPILAEVVGGALAADAYHITGTHPEGEGAALGMRLALKDAGISADQIDYINAHATSTPAGDVSELKAIEKIFGTVQKVSISATKSMTGHLLGAAGAIESIASVLAVQNDLIPPTINTTEVDDEFVGKFDLTLGQAKEKQVNYALNNTFGFGGHIAVSIFKKYVKGN